MTAPAAREGQAIPAGVARLAKALTARIRRESLARAAGLAVLGAASIVAALEIAARIAPLPALRILEASVLGAAALAAAALHARSRPAAGEWRGIADGMTARSGVFSAASGDARATRLTPLVADLAEREAMALLAGPLPRGTPSRAARLAVVAASIAVVTAVLPGKKSCGDDLHLLALRAPLLDEVRALEGDAARAGDAGLARLLAGAALDLEANPLTPESSTRLAGELGNLALEQARRLRELAAALGGNEMFQEVAAALRHEDPAALEPAFEKLVARVRDLEPRSPRTLEAAALLLDLAAAEHDRELKGALADAGEALSGASGSGSSERLSDLLPPLRRRIQSSRAIRDVVVTLESAAKPAAAGDVVAVRARRPPGADAGNASESGGIRLPDPGDFRSLVRPGTSEEAVLRRYFAVP